MIIAKTRKDLITVREAWEPVKCTDGPVTWTKRLVWYRQHGQGELLRRPPRYFPKYTDDQDRKLMP